MSRLRECFCIISALRAGSADNPSANRQIPCVHDLLPAGAANDRSDRSARQILGRSDNLNRFGFKKIAVAKASEELYKVCAVRLEPVSSTMAQEA